MERMPQGNPRRTRFPDYHSKPNIIHLLVFLIAPANPGTGPLGTVGPGPTTNHAFVRRWVGRLEYQVRRHPEQYFWFHRRWKTRPTGTTSGRDRT